jgi:hypothetical protein
MPWVVVGLFSLLLLHAAVTAKKKVVLGDLDKGIPDDVGKAVIVAHDTETDAGMLASFSAVLLQSGYPKAATVLLPKASPFAFLVPKPAAKPAPAAKPLPGISVRRKVA